MRKNCGNEKKDKDKNKVNWRNKGRKLTYISRKVQDKVKEAKKLAKGRAVSTAMKTVGSDVRSIGYKEREVRQFSEKEGEDIRSNTVRI